MKNQLCQLYEKIHKCHICPLMDSHKVLRKIESTNTLADVFIVSQSLAKDTLRESGINFFKIDGSMGSTGYYLEKFLNKIGRTIDPTNKKCVYNTEIVQCFPGKKGKGDRPPLNEEIINCKHFLIEEIDLIKPALILLMGKSSRDGFWKFILNKKLSPFSQSVGLVDYYNNIPVIPIQHASGINHRYSNMLNDEELINKIKGILGE